MAQYTLDTSLDKLPKVLQNFQDQIPFATSLALNATGYDVMKGMRLEVKEQLTNRNRYTERQVVYTKANKRNLVTEIGTKAWYMEDLIAGGNHTASNLEGRTTGKAGDIGYVHEGKRYMMIPDEKNSKKSGRLRVQARKNKPFVMKKNGRLFLVKRSGKKALPLIMLGQLIDQTHYKADTFDWENPANDIVGWQFPRNWVRSMVRAARTAK